jgi:hypothetical protein
MKRDDLIGNVPGQADELVPRLDALGDEKARSLCACR